MYIEKKSTLQSVLKNECRRRGEKRVIYKDLERSETVPMNYLFVHKGPNNETSSMLREMKMIKNFFFDNNMPYKVIYYTGEDFISYELFDYVLRWKGMQTFNRNINTNFDYQIRRTLHKDGGIFDTIKNETVRELYNICRKHNRIRTFSVSEDNIGKIAVGISEDEIRVLIPRIYRGHINLSTDGPIPSFLKDRKIGGTSSGRND